MTRFANQYSDQRVFTFNNHDEPLIDHDFEVNSMARAHAATASHIKLSQSRPCVVVGRMTYRAPYRRDDAIRGCFRTSGLSLLRRNGSTSLSRGKRARCC